MKSPLLDQDTDLLSYTVLVGGTELKDEIRLYSLEVHKEVNKISKAEIYVLDGNMHKEEFKIQDKEIFKPGAEVEIKLGYHQDNKTVFKGIVVKTGMRIRHTQHSLIYVECADKCIKMTMERKSKYFYNRKDSQIIQDLASDSGISAEVDSTTVTHKEIIQYYSTNWDFAVSRAEANGLIVFTDEGKFIAKKPELSSGEVKVKFGTEIIKSNLNFNGRSQLKDVTSYAWMHSEQETKEKKSEEPSINQHGSLDGKQVAGDFNTKPFKAHHSGPVTTDELKVWSKAKLLKSRLSRIQGTVTFQGMADINPNSIIKLEKTGKYFEGNGYISGVTQILKEGNWNTEVKIGLQQEWFTETKPQIQSSAASGLMPGIEGLYVGKVKKIHDDPDGEHRVQVTIPMIEEGEGVWARFTMPYATKENGAFFFPELDDEVLLGFLQGDARYPIILGAVYSSKLPGAYTPDKDNSIKGFVTKQKMKLTFEDKPDTTNIIMETPKGQKITFSDEREEIILEDKFKNKMTFDTKGIEIIDKHKNKIRLHSGGIEIDAPMGKDIIATAGGKIEAKATMDILAKGLNATLDGKISTKVKGKMVDVDGVAMTTVKGKMTTLDGTATAIVKGGIVMIN